MQSLTIPLEQTFSQAVLLVALIPKCQMVSGYEGQQ